MEHWFLINPRAGKEDRSREIIRQVEKLRREIKSPCRIFVSRAPGEITQEAKCAGETGREIRLYACGGDGTLNETAAGAVGFPNLSLSCYPTGSGNDFIKQFRNPEKFFDLRSFQNVETRAIDYIDAGGHPAVNIFSAGFDARIGTSIDAFRRHPLLSGARAYRASVVVNLLKGVAKPFRVELEDGTVVEDKLSLVCVCNGSWYGGSYNPVPEASMFDGLLDVLVVKKVSRLTVAKVIGAYQKGRYRDYPKLIRHFRTRALTISTPEEEPMNLDGELLRCRRLPIRLVPKGLRFFAPAGCFGES